MASEAMCGRCGWRGRGCTAAACVGREVREDEMRPCGHVAPADPERPEWCAVCERLQAADEATEAERVVVLRELSEALSRTAPIVDEVPYSLTSEVRVERPAELRAEAARLPW